MKFFDIIKYTPLGWVVNAINKYTGSAMTTGEIQAMTAEQNFNASQAEEARNWEKMMSDTSYQRGVVDMQKAGLNPALMYGSGASGASTPSGASASSSVSLPQGGDMISALLNMTMQQKQLNIQKQIAEMNNATSRANAETAADATKYASDQQRTSAKEGNEIRSKEVDQFIAESNERINKLKEETNNEKLKGSLLEIQKRIDEATATDKEAFAAVAKQFYNAQIAFTNANTKASLANACKSFASASLDLFQTAVLRSPGVLDAQVEKMLNEGLIVKDKLSQQEFAWYKDYLVNCFINGRIPETQYLRGKDGSKIEVAPPDLNRMMNMMQSLGITGPTTISNSQSKGVRVFGVGDDTSNSNTIHYSPGWKD